MRLDRIFYIIRFIDLRISFLDIVSFRAYSLYVHCILRAQTMILSCTEKSRIVADPENE